MSNQKEIISMPDFGFQLPAFIQQKLQNVIDICNTYGEGAMNEPDYWNLIDQIESYLKDAYTCEEMREPDALTVMRWCGVS